MRERSVAHATFVLHRRYAVPAALVFAAWADPAAKARWFGADEHELDFRVGGVERTAGRTASGSAVAFESLYREILPDERIVYTSVLTLDGTLATVSLTTVEFRPLPTGSEVAITESGAYLDGLETPALREQGTQGWLGRLATHLEASPTGGDA